MVVKRNFRSALLVKGGLCPTPVDNTDVSGSVLAEFISRPVTDCCSLCKLTAQCTAFAWTSDDDITGTCVMKSGTDLSTLSGSKAAVLWEYTSGRLESKATFTPTNVPGSKLRVEYTAKVPTAEGAWPALWMLGIEGTLYGTWPSEGEIDVMEWVYQLGDSYVSALHWKSSDDWGTAAPVQRPDISNQLHTYGIEYSHVPNDEYIQFYYIAPNGTLINNGPKATPDVWTGSFRKCRRTFTPGATLCSPLAPFDNQMFLIMNIAIGGNWGGCCGVDDYSAFNDGVQMHISSVKVFQLTSA